MLGRAGRPDYDDVGYGWVICDSQEAERYRRLLSEGTPLESRLAEELDAHLVAEVATGTVTSFEDVFDWLDTTFYAVRAASAPDRYDYGGRLRQRVRETLEGLVDRGFVATDGDLGVEGTALGRLTSRYYLRLATADRFHDLAQRSGPVDRGDVLEAVAGAAEFDSVSCRQSERDAVDAVLSGTDTPLEGGHRKVLGILRASTTGTTPGELRSDAWVIRQNALRLLAALREFLETFGDPGALPANLARRVEARVEHAVSADAVGLTAIDGVGAGRAKKLAADGIATPADVIEAGAGGLVAAGLSEGVAERVVESARSLPAVEIDWGAFPDTVARGANDMREVTVRSTAGGARAGVAVTVNGVAMTDTDTYLGGATVPVGVFGGDADEMEYVVTVAFPDLPLAPVRESRTVTVE
jgi:replicative superfamily II helicase